MAVGKFLPPIISKVITASTLSSDQKMQAIATSATNKVMLLMDFQESG